MAAGTWCVLRVGSKHLVLMRPNPDQFGHLGLEIMMGLRPAKVFRAPFWLIRPEKVVNTALYEFVVDGVKIRVVDGWRGAVLKAAFLPDRLVGSAAHNSGVLYGTPFYFLVTLRFHAPDWWAQYQKNGKIRRRRFDKAVHRVKKRVRRGFAKVLSVLVPFYKASKRIGRKLHDQVYKVRKRIGRKFSHWAWLLKHGARNRRAPIIAKSIVAARNLCLSLGDRLTPQNDTRNANDASKAKMPEPAMAGAQSAPVLLPAPAAMAEARSAPALPPEPLEVVVAKTKRMGTNGEIFVTRKRMTRKRQPLLIVGERRKVQPTYYKRLWIDQIPPFRIPRERLPALDVQAEKLFGIGPKARIVGLHLREPGFKSGREVHEVKPSRRNDSLRNVSITNYLPAIDDLVGRGFTIVRIGDPTMTPLKRSGVIDLATSPDRTDWLEAYCISRSDFLIGCESGAAVLAWMCHKPMLTLNATDPLAVFPIRESDIFTFKRVRDKLDGRTLGPLDLLFPEYLENLRKPERFEYFDNSAEDILEAVEDMLEIVEHGVAPETPEQREFRLWALSVGVRIRLENDGARKWGPHHGYCGRGRIAPSFARKYMGPEIGERRELAERSGSSSQPQPNI